MADNSQGLDMKEEKSLSASKATFYFVISLIINSAGNVLTLVTSTKIHPSFLGSAYWTAAEANLGVALHWNLFWAFLILGMLISVLNAVLVGKFDVKRILGNLIFMVPFSAMIQIFEDFFLGKYPIFSGLPDAKGPWMVAFYVLLNFFGVALIGTAISIYQRVNFVLHPADDLMQILRFKYFKGRAAWAMWASYIPPTLMAIIAIIITRQFTNFGLGTIFAFLFQGAITGWADIHVFSKLKHQKLDVGKEIK
ncbi:fructose permease [Lentilactobacillus sp. Marseille-Q4993]|uniref:fructose permease n=1 Tax=Lentilactobacillus sp. Marseille-Q4993 TaxID=3039492 RepID=UPI0024BC1D75|nr:fructose permease [Lentilactobacillus sp. Marseille-Q4993]